MPEKELIFSITKKDCKFEYFSGTGAGGQHRNKCQNSVRCKHLPSGAVGTCQDYRSRDKNQKIAFGRMARSEKFQAWFKVEAARQLGQLEDIERKVEKELEKVKLEVKDDNGYWKIVEELEEEINVEDEED
jgi:protein subunit release factor B